MTILEFGLLIGIALFIFFIFGVFEKGICALLDIFFEKRRYGKKY